MSCLLKKKHGPLTLFELSVLIEYTFGKHVTEEEIRDFEMCSADTDNVEKNYMNMLGISY